MVSFLDQADDQMDATQNGCGGGAAEPPLKLVQPQTTGERNKEELDDEDRQPIDEDEQLRRILMCKRLSEGCNRMQVASGGGGGSLFGRKNSLHLIGEELAPVTEGVPMRHMSLHTSNGNVVESAGRKPGGGGNLSKRNSQDDGISAASCSSSTSLDNVGVCGGSCPAGGSSASGSTSSSSGRRRSSTVSQCSSVLSEGTRQVLNFDLSPDLAPDSSLLEANAISPTELDSIGQRRPASPEPFSFSSSFEFARPSSQLSASGDGDELMLSATPDDVDEVDEASETTNRLAAAGDESKIVSENIERLINNVSSVCKVSQNEASRGDDSEQDQKSCSPQMAERVPSPGAAAAMKRAHTPFGAGGQRAKLSLLSNSPTGQAAAATE